MPTRKIGDLLNHAAVVCRPVCRHPEHNPPTHQVFENGVYEHECPACHATQTFVVYKPTLTTGPGARLG